jgi:pSer/pThr/pTyr-binding forkhead associated (FHA) protein
MTMAEPEPPPRAKPVRREATHLETPEEIERALQALRPLAPREIPPKPGLAPQLPVTTPAMPGLPRVAQQSPVPSPQIISARPAAVQQPVVPSAQPAAISKPIAPHSTEMSGNEAYRPIIRPSMAVLTVFDDGSEEGEMIRLRTDRFTIGRTQGDLTIPFDDRISSSHIEVLRLIEDKKTVWKIRDLGSTNGTFIRVKSRSLKNESEFLIGHARFRFLMPEGSGGSSQEFTVPTGNQTVGWGNSSPLNAAVPQLQELGPNGPLRQIPLSRNEIILGTDAAQCQVTVQDRFVSAKHARVYLDPTKGRWFVSNLQSVNGTWFRLAEFEIETACHFQIGEQRFLLRVL